MNMTFAQPAASPCARTIGVAHLPTPEILLQLQAFRDQAVDAYMARGRQWNGPVLKSLSPWDRDDLGTDDVRHLFIHEDDDPQAPIKAVARINHARGGKLPYMSHFTPEQLTTAGCNAHDVEFCRFLIHPDFIEDGGATVGRIYMGLAQAQASLQPGGRVIGDIMTGQGSRLRPNSYQKRGFQPFTPPLIYDDHDYGPDGADSQVFWTLNDEWQLIRAAAFRRAAGRGLQRIVC